MLLCYNSVVKTTTIERGRTVRLTRKWYRNNPTDYNKELLIRALLQAGRIYEDCKLVNI